MVKIEIFVFGYLKCKIEVLAIFVSAIFFVFWIFGVGS